MADLTKSISLKEAKRIARKECPIGKVVTLDKSDALCTAIVIGHIFYNSKSKEPLSVTCKLLILRGKDRFVAMLHPNKGSIEVWSSSIDVFFEEDWTSDDWVLEF